ncbi:MAG: hypothetical protein IPO14_01610 [Saprospiraceae bacterium]|nr:hypothetical protein [Saprospiraceae bacterium]
MKNISFLWLFMTMCTIVYGQKFGGAQLSYGFATTTFGFEKNLKEKHFGTVISVEGRLASKFYYLSLGFTYHKLRVSPEIIDKNLKPFENKEDIHVIKVPVSIGYMPFNRNWGRFRIYAGVGVNIVTNVDENSIPVALSQFENSTMFYHFGAGFDIKFISIDYVFENSFSNFVNNVEKSKSQTQMLKLGVFF